MSRIRTIRARLLVCFALVALLPAVGISIGSIAISIHNGRQQAISQLQSVAALKALAIQSWTQSLEQQLVVASQTEGEFERISVVLDLAQDFKYYDFYNKAVRLRLKSFVNQSSLLQEIFLLDRHGRVVLSTDTTQEGKQLGDQPFFRQGLQGPYVQLPFAVDSLAGTQRLERDIALVSIPVLSHDQNLLGLMVGRAGVAPLDEVLQKPTGLGTTGKAYLVNRDHALLVGTTLTPTVAAAGAPGPTFIRTQGIDLALSHRADGSGIYTDYRGTSVIGVNNWLPELEAVLSVEQDMSEAFGTVYALVGINITMGLVAAALAVVASLLTTRSISTPLINLVGTAQQITAGDLNRFAKVERDDEVGTLAQAFNSMTAQLRDLINGLEERVKERTHALEDANQALQRRAIQLETTIRVSQGITSLLGIDALMARVVKLIRDSFGYYRVQLFLIDPGVDQLVMRASSGQINPQFQRIEMGRTSLNVRAVQTGGAQVANDVAHDPRYLADKRLPNTRSELVVPLRLGDQVIGTLDVHDIQVNAFAVDDVRVIQSLGDQIAIAIENARLYDKSRELAVLEERTRLARELHDSVTQSLYSIVLLAEGWRRLGSSRDKPGIDDQLTRIGEITQQALKEMRLLIHELRPPALERERLLGALHRRLDAVEKRAGVEARLLADDLVDLPPAIEDGLYRIAQEALNNALKHAAARSVTVRMCLEDRNVILEVTDDGCGFDLSAADQSGGMGLANMRDRARQMRGTCTILAAPGQGTVIRTCVPLDLPAPLQAAAGNSDSMEPAQ